MTLHHLIVTSIDVDQPAGGTRCYARSAIDAHALVVRPRRKTITGVLVPGPHDLNPAKTSQTDPVLARCTSRYSASFDDRDNAPSSAYRGHHWRACIRMRGAACGDEHRRRAWQQHQSVEPSARTKLWLLACRPQW